MADEDEDDSWGDTSIDEEEDGSNSGPSLGETDEQERLSFAGVVVSLGPEALTLEDDTSFALNDETRADGAPSVGAAVRGSI